MYIPLRMCIACRQHRPKAELIRLAADENTQCIVPDIHNRPVGRGAYVCRDLKCIKQAEKKRVPERHLKLPACDGLYRRLEDMI